MRGLDSSKRVSLLKKMDCRVIRAFTPVFDGLCPAMTAFVSIRSEIILAVIARSVSDEAIWLLLHLSPAGRGREP